MKKILFLAFTSLGLLITSCSSDDNDDNSNAEVSGTWKISKKVILSGVDGAVLDTNNITGCLAQDTFVYEDNNTFKETYHSTNGSACDISHEETGNYLYDPITKILRVRYTGESFAGLIYLQNISGTTIEAYSFDDDFNDDGVTDKYIRYMYK